MDSAHKAERPRLCGRGRSSLFSIYLTWLQYAANYHRANRLFRTVSRSGDAVKGAFVTRSCSSKQKREPLSRLPLEFFPGKG
jgi:hypothetical protein